MPARLVCSRRTFLAGAAAAGAAVRAPGWSLPFFTKSAADFDDRLTLLVSDLHINGRADKPQHHQGPRFAKLVAEVLKMDPLPRRCLVLGDIAWDRGDPQDYAASAVPLKQLADAGIELALALGNHDHRKTFAAAWPELAAQTKVPGSVVSVVQTPDCDFLLMDSMSEVGVDERDYNHVYGELPPAEQEWLAAELPKWPRPVFVCAHHPLTETFQGRFTQLEVCGRPLKNLLADVPCLAGYIQGHDHRWQRSFEVADWKRRKLFQNLTLPSTGHWGDIGYVLLRSAPGRAVAELRQDDFYFPREMPPDQRGADWSAMVAANQGAKCHFVWKQT